MTSLIRSLPQRYKQFLKRQRKRMKIRLEGPIIYSIYSISLAIHAQASASARALLLVFLVNQVHHHLNHHILLFCFALSNHQG